MNMLLENVMSSALGVSTTHSAVLHLPSVQFPKSFFLILGHCFTAQLLNTLFKVMTFRRPRQARQPRHKHRTENLPLGHSTRQ